MIQPQSPAFPYTFRPPTLDDLDAVLIIQRASGTADFGYSPATEGMLRASWQPDKITLSTDAWLAIAPDDTPVAYAEVPQTEQPVWVSLWVLPEHRGNGIEAEILRLAESRTVAHAQAAIILGRAGDLNPAARHAFDQAGYNNYLSFQIMQIDLTELPPAPRWPAGIAVRPFILGRDEQGTYMADEEASEDKGYHAPMTFDAWATRMNLNGPGFDPTLWFLAYSDREIVGVALNYYEAASGTAWIDHLGVRRPWRKKGLGEALLLHSFREFYARGVHTVKLSVDSASLTNAPRLYTDVGMHVIQLYHIYRKDLTVPN